MELKKNILTNDEELECKTHWLSCIPCLDGRLKYGFIRRLSHYYHARKAGTSAPAGPSPAER